MLVGCGVLVMNGCSPGCWAHFPVYQLYEIFCLLPTGRGVGEREGVKPLLQAVQLWVPDLIGNDSLVDIVSYDYFAYPAFLMDCLKVACYDTNRFIFVCYFYSTHLCFSKASAPFLYPMENALASFVFLLSPRGCYLHLSSLYGCILPLAFLCRRWSSRLHSESYYLIHGPSPRDSHSPFPPSCSPRSSWILRCLLFSSASARLLHLMYLPSP